MGAIHFSLDPDLARQFAEKLGIKTFVETGTFRGESAEIARALFEEVHTCELSPELHEAACRKFADQPSVHCHLGDSAERLADIRRSLGERPALYWLDAHWCDADDTAGAESQCPLLDELRALAPLHERSVVWIDDARYFLSPPPHPLVTRGWPTFHEVQQALRELAGDHHRLTFPSDTILLYPAAEEDWVLDYVHHHGADWLKLAHEAREVVPKLREHIAFLEAESAKRKASKLPGFLRKRSR